MEETSNCISIISFTEKGEALANRLSIYLLQSQKKDQVGCECDRDLVKCIKILFFDTLVRVCERKL